ncbi:MAG: tetratricopeptide repeat protein, partial [Oscillibacter sp.]|nr:tetratricopeptide repeat protein [Oscillibacter sp.]
LTIELFCWNQYHYEIAENLCARLLRACDTQHVERPLQGKIYRRRGEVYRKKRQYESALKDDNMALSMFTDKLDIAEAENGIGIVYMHMGEDEESLPKRREYYRQAMRFCQHAQELREEHGAPPLERACSRHIIGTICYDLGEYEKALDNHRRALKLRLAHRCNQLDVAASYNRIGTDYLILGDLENAEKMTRKALELREETVGPNHPHYAWSLYNLFLLHREQGKFQIALLEIERVVDIRKSALGSAHHDTRQAVQEYERLKKGTDEACAPVTSAPTCQKSVAALTANGVKAAEDARVSGHTANRADAES